MKTEKEFSKLEKCLLNIVGAAEHCDMCDGRDEEDGFWLPQNMMDEIYRVLEMSPEEIVTKPEAAHDGKGVGK